MRLEFALKDWPVASCTCSHKMLEVSELGNRLVRPYPRSTSIAVHCAPVGTTKGRPSSFQMGKNVNEPQFLPLYNPSPALAGLGGRSLRIRVITRPYLSFEPRNSHLPSAISHLCFSLLNWRPRLPAFTLTISAHSPCRAEGSRRCWQYPGDSCHTPLSTGLGC